MVYKQIKRRYQI